MPDDLDAVELPALTWAVFSVSGPYPQALQQVWADTAAVWFPSNPYRLVDGPALIRTVPKSAPGAHQAGADWSEADCELWLPVEHA